MKHYTSPLQQGLRDPKKPPRELPPGYRWCANRCGTAFGSGAGRTAYCSETCRYEAMMKRRRVNQAPDVDGDWMPRLTRMDG